MFGSLHLNLDLNDKCKVLFFLSCWYLFSSVVGCGDMDLYHRDNPSFRLVGLSNCKSFCATSGTTSVKKSQSRTSNDTQGGRSLDLESVENDDILVPANENLRGTITQKNKARKVVAASSTKGTHARSAITELCLVTKTDTSTRLKFTHVWTVSVQLGTVHFSDLFCGSGSALLAAIASGRSCVAVDLNT